MNLHYTSLYEGHILKDRYVILSLLGKGGMGRVYLAQDLRLEGKLWAIKEVNVAVEKDAFIQEAKILASLNHPSLPKIADYYPPDDNGYSFIVMDYIKGTSIAEQYEQKKEVFSLEQIFNYMIQLCKVFQYLHSYKPYPIIYRDLKPTNIMIDENREIKLIDFGIARLYQQEKQGDTVQIGTIGFAAPEQYGNQQTDHRTDIYQFGILLRYLLTGQLLPLSLTDLEVDMENNQNKRTSNDLIESCKQHVMEVIHKATQFNPEDRYQAIEEIREELERLQQTFNQTQQRKQLSSASINFSESSYYPNSIHTKYVLIGSLWRGAGSTTLATNLARSLVAKNIQVAYVEYPTIQPYMFDYLNIIAQEQAKGLNYEDIRLLIQSNRHKGNFNFWEEKGMRWIVNDPRRSTQQEESWSNEHMLQLTHLLRHETVTIIDVSNHWLHPGLQSFLEHADHIYICVEPNPVKIEWTSSNGYPSSSVSNPQQPPFFQKCESTILENLVEKEHHGTCSIEFVTMKMDAAISQREWNKCLSKKPLASISYLPYPELIKSVWDSTFIYDHSEYTENLMQSLRPLVNQIIPNLLEEKLDKKMKGQKGLKKWVALFKT